MNLQDYTLNSVKKFSFEGNEVNAKCVKVYDGDSITVIFSIFNLPHMQYNIRLYNIDTAEIRSKNEEEKIKALEAKKIVSDLILNKVIKLKLKEFDKYGRILAEVYCDGINCDISSYLYDKKLGYRYDGGSKDKQFFKK